MSPVLLTRRHYRHSTDDALAIIGCAGEIALARGRAHEVCGPARRTFALLVAARTSGPVLWITPAWGSDAINPHGIGAFIDPGRILFIHPIKTDALLWSAEEALRLAAAGLVIADLPEPPGLTQVRRLHLAAEANPDVGTRPIGLVLTPEGAAPGVETRWHMETAHHPTGQAWEIARLRARTLPPARWRLSSAPWKPEMTLSPLPAIDDNASLTKA